MKLILDLKLAVTDENFISSQFETSGTEKNILFVNPQLSSKHFYKMLLPLFKLRSEKIGTAISSLSEYDTEGQLFGENEWTLTDQMINWGKDQGVPVYIVFPFTAQPLVSEVYTRIRETNPYANIVYTVDFNFYELGDRHPFKYIFNEHNVISSVEDNMYFSDMVLTSNAGLGQYLILRINELAEKKYSGEATPLRNVKVLRYAVDPEIMMGNVDYDIQAAESSTNTVHTTASVQLIEKTTEVANEVKKKEEEKKIKEGKKRGRPKLDKTDVETKIKLKKNIKTEIAKPETHGSKAKRKRAKREKKG